MLHSGLLNLMIRSTCFGHYYAHHQELATIQMASACGTSSWLWQVAGLVYGWRFKRPVRGMLKHPSSWFYSLRIILNTCYLIFVRCLNRNIILKQHNSFIKYNIQSLRKSLNVNPTTGFVTTKV
jgi:hypothetical protein